MKDIRWYEVEQGILYVYDSPYVDKSVSMSIVSVEQMAYYRGNFRMLKIAGKECPREYV